jgi:hypothetical protein
MKRGSALQRRTPLRSRRWGVSRKTSKAEARGDGGTRSLAVDDRRKGKGASPSGVRSASPTKPAYPKPAQEKGTKHSRRVREWGRMAYERSLGCGVALAFMLEFRSDGLSFLTPGPCSGGLQYMHLHLGKNAGRRRAPDDSGACGCEKHHQDIDGRIGGKAPWYVAFGFDGQQRLKLRLVTRQRVTWDALGPVEQARWDNYAEANRSATRRARRAA